jgi:hypothetical protein
LHSERKKRGEKTHSLKDTFYPHPFRILSPYPFHGFVRVRVRLRIRLKDRDLVISDATNNTTSRSRDQFSSIRRNKRVPNGPPYKPAKVGLHRRLTATPPTGAFLCKSK